MRKLLAVLFVIGCGPMPYPACYQAHEERCNGPVIEVCDGEYWESDMNCAEDLAGPGGIHVEKQCTETGGRARCL